MIKLVYLLLICCLCYPMIGQEMDSKNEYCYIIGHRGAPAFGGENTLFGFQKAIDLGADGFELDLLPTKDGKFIVGHDFELSRLIGTEQLTDLYPEKKKNGNKWYVTDFNQEELRRLKVTFPAPGAERYDYKDLTDQYRMPTLEEAIDLFEKNRVKKSKNHLILYIEIKTKTDFKHRMNEGQIRDELTRILQHCDLLNDEGIWLQSFDYAVMDVLGESKELNQLKKSQLAFDSIKEINKFRSKRRVKKYLRKQIIDRNLQMVHLWKVPSVYLMRNKKIPILEIANEMDIPVHFYTFRDPRYKSDYKLKGIIGIQGFESPEQEISFFIKNGARALMTDYVSSALKARAVVQKKSD